MGYKTGKKELILSFLSKNSDSSFSLEEICAAILTDGHGRSTVYRLVSELVAAGQVRRLSDEMTRRYGYQYIGDEHCREHLHLKCKDCGRLIHLDEDISRELEEKILNSRGFSVDEGALLFGTCESCFRSAADTADKSEILTSGEEEGDI